METILIILDSEKLENPDLDIRYELPDMVEQYTNGELCDNGYDHLTDTELGIWLETKSAKESYGKVIEFFNNHMVCGNDLALSAKVYISDKEAADLEECILVYDGEEQIPDEAMRVNNRIQKIGRIILKIAKLITKDDKVITDTLKTKLSELEDTEEQWECFTETLKSCKYICECDEDMELDEFLEILLESSIVKSNVLPVKKDKLDSDEDLYQWCEALDEQWEKAGYCMAIYELENGNEIVFPCGIDKLEEVGTLAKEICVNIVPVAEF